MLRLAIITTHPVQYNAPLFKLLTKRGIIYPKVFYTFGDKFNAIYDKGFAKNIKWDLPLLEGYEYCFANNTAMKPGLDSFRGVVTPYLAKQIEQFCADAILVYGWNYNSHLQLMRQFKNKTPLFFRGDSTLIDETKGIKTVARRWWLRYVYSLIDKAFYVGKNNKDYFLKHGLKSENLIFAPHAIDNFRFSKKVNDFEISQFRTKNNIPKGALVFLFAAKFELKKDPLLLIEAFKKLKINDVYLLMVGSGTLEQQVKMAANGCVNILFSDFCNQSVMPLLYQSADVFVMSSSGPGETWGLAVNEAMACGLPIIASNKTGCAADLIEEHKNGCFFEAGNAAQLQQCMEFMIKNKYKLKEFGLFSEKIIEQYSFSKICNALEQTMIK